MCLCLLLISKFLLVTVESLILSAVANYTDPQRYLVFVINNYDLLVSGSHSTFLEQLFSVLSIYFVYNAT